MNFKSFEKTDRKILFASCMLLLTACLLIWQDGWIYRLVQVQRDDLVKIGSVSEIDRDVRRRLQVALSWIPLSKKNDIYQGDSIFTGASSTVTIETEAGEKISIAPNSLVVISKQKNGLNINIGFGSIEGNVSGNSSLVISSNNTITELSGQNGAVKIDAGEGNKMIVSVVSGEVTVKSADGEETLRRDDSSLINLTGRQQEFNQPNIELLTPLEDQLFQAKEDKPVLFSWESRKKFSRMKIKVATDREFKNVVVDSPVDGKSFDAYNLPIDVNLYWQVIAEGGISTVHKFNVVGNRSPIPIYPKPGFQFYYDPTIQAPLAGAQIELQWEPGSPSNHYEVILAQDMKFLKNPKKYKTKDKKLDLGLLTKGTYYWRVRSITFADLAWSEPSQFRVGPEPTRILAPPVPLTLGDTFLIPTKIHSESVVKIRELPKKQYFKYIEEYPRLKWASVSKAEEYLVEIARDKSFKTILLSQKTRDTSLVWKKTSPGKFYWRAKAISRSAREGLYTQSQELKISVQPPQNLTPSKMVEEVPDAKLLLMAPPPIRLKWNPTLYTNSYEVEYSQSNSFAESKKVLTQQSEINAQIQTAGALYWRVRSLDKSGAPVSPFSAIYTLDYQRIYKDPTLLSGLVAIYPAQQDSIILVAGEQPELEFKWSRPFKDTNYRIELSADAAFANIYFSDTTQKNYYKYKGEFPSRIVYWRVRAENDKFVSDWTGANRFLLTHENQAFDFEISDKMFQARIQAQVRQREILAARERKLARLRTPASDMDLQLDTPQITEAPEIFTLESNFNSEIPANTLVNLNNEKFFALIKNTPIIKWQKVIAAERYVVEVARDLDFKKIVSKTPCWDPIFVWETPLPGRFYYRVQAFNDRYTRSAHSAVGTMNIAVEAPASTGLDTFAEVFDVPRELWQPPRPFELSWQPVVFARAYEVEFSEDRLFQLTKIFKTTDIKTQFTVSKAGLYYWRVRAINEHGVGISSFSPMRSVEIVQTNRNPANVTELAGVFPKDRTMLFVGEGLMNLAFYWLTPRQSEEHLVEVSNTAQFTKILATAKGRSGHTAISHDLPDGKLFWRVRKGTEVSTINEFLLRRERNKGD